MKLSHSNRRVAVDHGVASYCMVEYRVPRFTCNSKRVMVFKKMRHGSEEKGARDGSQLIDIRTYKVLYGASLYSNALYDSNT